jgi:hypothetical protein
MHVHKILCKMSIIDGRFLLSIHCLVCTVKLGKLSGTV